MEILRLVWVECEWKSVCENSSRNARARDAGMACADDQRHNWQQMGKHGGMCGLCQEQEVCAVIRPQHRWLITRRPVP